MLRVYTCFGNIWTDDVCHACASPKHFLLNSWSISMWMYLKMQGRVGWDTNKAVGSNFSPRPNVLCTRPGWCEWNRTFSPENQCNDFLRSFSMPRNHKSMEHANHMRETFHPCPPDEKSVSGAKLCRLHIFSFMFLRCFSMLHVFFVHVCFRAMSFLCAVVLSSYASYAFANYIWLYGYAMYVYVG